jgi:hypothetical protein
MFLTLSFLAVRSEDPSVLTRLAAVASSDPVVAIAAATLLGTEERLQLVANGSVAITAEEPAWFSAGRGIPTVTGGDVTEAGLPRFTYDHLEQDLFRLEASLDEETGIVDLLLLLDDRVPVFDDNGRGKFSDPPPTPRSLVLTPTQDPLVLLAGSDTLVVLVPREHADRTAAEQAHRAQAVAIRQLLRDSEAPRSRRRVIDELLGP